MPFPTPLALLLPLVVTVSDAVPRFDVEPSCKGGLNSPGLNERYSQCLAEEKQAQQQLEQTWATWNVGDRVQCTGTARMGAPSYVELLTCLQMARDARNLKK